MAPANNLALGADRVNNGLLKSRDRGGVDQRPHQRGRIQRIAYAHLRVGAFQPLHNVVLDRLVHDQPARGRAALPCGSDGAE